MISKHFKYTSFNGLEVERDIYFNITESEYYDKELSREGGWIIPMQRALQAKNIPVMWEYFKEIILSSVGKISDDGESFIKTPEYTKWFTETPMYNELLMSFFKPGNEGVGAEFIKGVFPIVALKKMADAIKENEKPEEPPIDPAEA